MKETFEPSRLQPALGSLPCSVVEALPRAGRMCIHEEGGMGSPPARVNPEALGSPSGCENPESGAMDWEQAERPGPPSCPYSVMPGTKHPCRAAGLTASGLDNPRAGGSVYAASSAPRRLLQLSLPRPAPSGRQWAGGCMLQSAHGGIVTWPLLEKPSSLVLL